jgi:hypothetical protein
VTSIHVASCRSTPCWIHRPWSPIRTTLPPPVFFCPVVDLLRLSPLLPSGSADRSHRERGAFRPRGMFLLRRLSRPPLTGVAPSNLRPSRAPFRPRARPACSPLVRSRIAGRRSGGIERPTRSLTRRMEAHSCLWENRGGQSPLRGLSDTSTCVRETLTEPGADEPATVPGVGTQIVSLLRGFDPHVRGAPFKSGAGVYSLVVIQRCDIGARGRGGTWRLQVWHLYVQNSIEASRLHAGRVICPRTGPLL